MTLVGLMIVCISWTLPCSSADESEVQKKHNIPHVLFTSQGVSDRLYPQQPAQSKEDILKHKWNHFIFSSSHLFLILSETSIPHPQFYLNVIIPILVYCFCWRMETLRRTCLSAHSRRAPTKTHHVSIVLVIPLNLSNKQSPRCCHGKSGRDSEQRWTVWMWFSFWGLNSHSSRC